MKIETFQGGYDKNFSYIVWCEKTKFAAIIDPAVESNQIIEKIKNLNLTLTKIMITHTHFDHYRYLTDFTYYYPNIEIICHKESKKVFKDYNCRLFSTMKLFEYDNYF